ncbi:MAG: prepilin-type N-terminal cleavage/methylation domain-containing protein [Candidatus Omnitrophota bacterium]|jgi:type II secretory pathway pseudopilin PulG|nr:prepilin-type N-terminal cleavage/methylation domain-containing protein [Candidatus Omnitrophota bacterium]MDD3982516.1 prepilin-type N-terminal cleavage/methylation domain-containing protein [Candidatus Omnitrophota bacterium]
MTLKPRENKSFTLIEVLVSIIIAVIIFAALSKGMVGGGFLLKQVENKSRACGVTAAKMEEYLAKAYSALEPGTYSGDPVDYGSKPVFNWTVKVEKKWMGDDPDTVDQEGVPYNLITVDSSYDETDYKNIFHTKNIRFVNMVPYPYVHAEIKTLSSSLSVPPNSYTEIFRIKIDYEVAKDLMIIYNIAIKVKNAGGLEAANTIYTKCFVDSEGKDIETRTPIITQPLISNVVGVNNVPPGEHTVSVQWYKDTGAGDISLKEINVIVVAFEHKQS